jgi:AAA family ATP:ADP antiporter
MEFSRLRGILFPIHGHELMKFLPMGFMMFFILFNYNVLRDTKDTLIVNSAGAEALSLTKLIGTVPGALLIMLVYSKLSNILNREQLFYATLLPFVIFFALFALIIYPHWDALHPSAERISELTAAYPRLKTLFLLYGSWSYGLFYVLAELWGSVVLTLLFWQFANHIVSMNEAKRFYPLFGMLANFGVIAAGITVQHFSKIRGAMSAEVDPWGMTINYLMTAVVLAGLAVMAIYWWINRMLPIPLESCGPRKSKVKMSLVESFRTLMRSKHLGYIALIVICYGISQNVIEAVWKGQIRQVHSNENAYNTFMGQFTMTSGIVTICFMLIGTNIVRLFGWLISAMMTPVMIVVTGILFFSFVSFRDVLEPYTLWIFAMAPTVLSVWLGFFQNILSKSTKYSLFDPTKEMCYIPLDQESKIKGKAAVDVVGGRLGKSGGAFMQQFFLLVTGSSLVDISPYLAVVVLAIVLLWLVANRKLHQSLGELTSATGEPKLATISVEKNSYFHKA